MPAPRSSSRIQPARGRRFDANLFCFSARKGNLEKGGQRERQVPFVSFGRADQFSGQPVGQTKGIETRRATTNYFPGRHRRNCLQQRTAGSSVTRSEERRVGK